MSENFKKYIRKEHYPRDPCLIKFKAHAKKYVLTALTKREWKETEQENDWDIFWTDQKLFQAWIKQNELKSKQKVNHFFNSKQLTEEHLRIQNLMQYQQDLRTEQKFSEAESYNFFPRTYVLPQEYRRFFEEYKTFQHISWKIKQVERGKGTRLLTLGKLNELSQCLSVDKIDISKFEMESLIIQEVINNPLLVAGKCFDIKLHCLVTSFLKKTAYLYREGFAYFWSLVEENSSNQVKFDNITLNLSSNCQKEFGPWNLRNLKSYLISMSVSLLLSNLKLNRFGTKRINHCFIEIQEIVIKTLKAFEKVIIGAESCFELYEFDIMLDSNLKPWLLQVNSDFTVTPKSLEEIEYRNAVFDDLLTVIDLEKILTGKETQIGGFDLLCCDSRDDNKILTEAVCKLGFKNDRSKQLQLLAKEASIRLSEQYKSTVKNFKKVNAQEINIEANKENIPIFQPSKPSYASEENSTMQKTPRILKYKFSQELLLKKDFANLKVLSPSNSSTSISIQKSSGFSDILADLEKVKTLKQTPAMIFCGSPINKTINPDQTPTCFRNLFEPSNTNLTPKIVKLPPIVTTLIEKSIKKKSHKLSFDSLQQVICFPQSPISSTEQTTPSTGDSIGEVTENQKFSLDFQVLKMLHKNPDLSENSQDLESKKSIASAKREYLVRPIRTKKRIHTWANNLQEIKEEEESNVKQ